MRYYRQKPRNDKVRSYVMPWDTLFNDKEEDMRQDMMTLFGKKTRQ